jgi:toxin ParE1/3/4
MIVYKVEYTEQAESDLRGIYEYIAFTLLEPSIAKNQAGRIMSAVNGLYKMPERFPLYEKEPWGSRGFRVMPVNNYIVFFISEKAKKLVTIMRIIYSGRDIENELHSLPIN